MGVVMKDVASPFPMTNLNVDGIGPMLGFLLFCHGTSIQRSVRSLSVQVYFPGHLVESGKFKALLVEGVDMRLSWPEKS